MQANPGYARQQVQKRDNGVCTQCGCDTQAIRRRIAKLRGWTKYKNTRKKAGKKFGLSGEDFMAAANWGCWVLSERRADEAKARGRRVYRSPQPRRPEGMDEETAIKILHFYERMISIGKARLKRYQSELREQGFDPTCRKSFWDMDHIKEVVRGGDYQIDNLQTLCQPCHKAKTKRLAAERAAERRADSNQQQLDL